MEQRIKLSTKTTYDLEKTQLEQFYIAMALLQYPYLRTPEYNHHQLLLRLRNDYKRFNNEMIKTREKDPNNLILSQIQSTIQHHFGNLKLLTKL